MQIIHDVNVPLDSWTTREPKEPGDNNNVPLQLPMALAWLGLTLALAQSYCTHNQIIAPARSSTIHHSPFTILHSPFSIHHSPFTIRHSPFTIHDSIFSTCSKEVPTLYSSSLQHAQLVPDRPWAADPSGLPRSWTHRQLGRNNPPTCSSHQPAATSTTADQAAYDGGKRLDLCTGSARMLNPRKCHQPAGAVTVEKSPCMLRGIDRCGPSSTPRLKVA